jgi:hypothetical protein
MRKARSICSNLALAFIAIAVSVIICDLVVRMFVPVRNVGPSFTEYDAIYGKRLKNNFSGVRITPEFTMRLTTNSEGFRGPEQKALSRRPILFLGDSFTMGYGVTDGQEFPALVRESLAANTRDPLPVINAGMGDNGNGRWLIFLRREGKRLNPRLVVLQVCENDLEDNVRENLFDLAPDGTLRERPVPPPGLRRFAQEILERIPGLANSYLFGLARQIPWGHRSIPREFGDGGASIGDGGTSSRAQVLQFRILQKVLAICKEYSWPVLVVLGGIPDGQRQKRESFFLDSNVQTVVIPDKKERPDLYYKIDGHWNAAGQAFTAKRVLAAIARLRLVE